MFVKADLDDDGFVTGDDFYNIMTHRVYWDQWFVWFDQFELISLFHFLLNLFNQRKFKFSNED